MSGCGDNNPVIPVLQGKYLASSTPQNLLENLRRAYTSRDSVGYDSLFDATYAGQTIDNAQPGPPLTFTKADESLHIRALARSTTITSIVLSFGANPIRYTDAGDSTGWTSMQVLNPAVGVADGTTLVFTGANDIMVFKFRPTTPASGSPTDTTWKIVRWMEIKS